MIGVPVGEWLQEKKQKSDSVKRNTLRISVCNQTVRIASIL